MSKKVMIIDDDRVVLSALAGLLGARGYQVTTRSQAMGTTAALLQQAYDVVILDIEMPGLTGDGLLRAMYKNAVLGPRMPAVVIHSSLPAERIRRIASSHAVIGFIPKGDARNFVSTFEALLAGEPRQRKA
jgi:CheY-like chemotaxis protein